jgi:hypothetical protein
MKDSPQRHREHRDDVFSLAGRRRPEKTICRLATMVNRVDNKIKPVEHDANEDPG